MPPSLLLGSGTRDSSEGQALCIYDGASPLLCETRSMPWMCLKSGSSRKSKREYPEKKWDAQIWLGNPSNRFRFWFYWISFHFLIFLNFFRKYNIRSVYTGYGTGRYRIFSFLLSSLVRCLINVTVNSYIDVTHSIDGFCLLKYDSFRASTWSPRSSFD